MPQKLALIGFGTVGQGLAEILRDKGASLKESLGFETTIVGVVTRSKGSLYHPNGLDIPTLLETVQQTNSFNSYPDAPGLLRGMDTLTLIRESNANTVVELSYTDINTGQPAIDHCRTAFESGKHVVTANKGPVALAYPELAQLAQEKGVRWGFEGTVMAGTPAVRLPLATLAGTDISAVQGILNGTTNYILTQMELEGLSFAVALQQAQELGYAEADPTADVEGYDALAKVIILANVLMGAALTKDDIPCQGISQLTAEDIQQAKRNGKRWKLIGRVAKAGDGVTASVAPQALSLSDPLAGVMGPTNAITYTTDLAGPITVVGAGAGPITTGFSVLIDLINIERHNI